jgi:hypothetical protein
VGGALAGEAAAAAAADGGGVVGLVKRVRFQLDALR